VGRNRDHWYPDYNYTKGVVRSIQGGANGTNYRWQGQVEAADEILLVIKTTLARVDALSRRITALHSYDVPEVIVVEPQGGTAPYLAWLAAGVADDRP
jgi:uncharacterized protein involved in tolerance to divalent cations